MSLMKRMAEKTGAKLPVSEQQTQGTMAVTTTGGLQSQQQAQSNAGSRSKIRVYFFNIDLMYVLKARLIVLG